MLQEVFLKLARRRGFPIREMKCYLLKAARNEAYTLLRKRRRETSGWDIGEVEEQPASFQRQEEKEVLRAALAELPPEQREVVVLKVFEEMTFEEIGKSLQLSANTAASRYRYAMKKLRQALGDSTLV